MFQDERLRIEEIGMNTANVAGRKAEGFNDLLAFRWLFLVVVCYLEYEKNSSCLSSKVTGWLGIGADCYIGWSRGCAPEVHAGTPFHA